MNRGFSLVTLGLILFLLISCATGKNSVVSPDPDLSQNQEITAGQAINTPNTHLLGVYDVRIDPDTMSGEIVPLRTADVTLNVTPFFDYPPMNIGLTIPSFYEGADYWDFDVDFELTHPLPALTQYTLFDVMLVFLGDGSETCPGPYYLKVAGENDQQMLNPDGFTRWFNAQEFQETAVPILAYDPSYLGVPGYTPSAELNPYKYFTNGLASTATAFYYVSTHPLTRGYFSTDAANHRVMEVRFPKSKPLQFQLMVVASWTEPNGLGEPYLLSNFPPDANAEEALLVDIVDSSDAFYTGGAFGGYVNLEIKVIDWSADTVGGVIDEYVIRCYSDAWSGAYNVDMHPVGGGGNYDNYEASIPVETLSSNDPLEVWLQIDYNPVRYDNEFDVPNSANGFLTSYFKTEVEISSTISGGIEVTSPNGGEIFLVGRDYEITWNSSLASPGTVKIEYSKDNFSTPILIESAVPNTGSYMWNNIPDDPTSSAKIRVTFEPSPTVFDTSDNAFNIEYPSITVKKPNGGEIWFIGSSHNVTWDTNIPDGTVTIEYSKDGFTTPISIVSGADNTGSYTWNPIPDDPSAGVRVRVIYDQDTLVRDTSDANFTIMDSAFDITSPSGGEVWFTAFNYEITWTSSIVGGTVRLDYFLDSDSDTMYLIKAGEANDGSYMWNNLPEVNANDVRVRITYEPNEFFFGESADIFTISLPELDIVQPDGGEVLEIAGSYSIQWDTFINSGTVDIYYSKDNFSSDNNLIVSGHDINSNYNWTNIPDDPTYTARVKVIYTPIPSIFGVSDNDFDICYGDIQNITGFTASDGDPANPYRRVVLSWDSVSCHADPDVEIRIQRYEYDWDPPNQTPGTWGWEDLVTLATSATTYNDTNCRYSGSSDPVNYRVRLDNGSGGYSAWQSNTGYPKLRGVKVAYWCWSSNGTSSGALYPWSRATADNNYAKDFWNDYGLDLVMENSGDWFYFTNANWRIQTGNEPSAMHQACGQPYNPDCINIYYFESYGGSPRGGFCMLPCDPNQHTTLNTFICIFGEPYDPVMQIIVPHELGHAVSRYYDEYLVDSNGNCLIDYGETCYNSFLTDYCYLYGGATLGNWYMFCADSATYPASGWGSSGSMVPKNLMWYSWQTAVSQYNLVDLQYLWTEAWLYSHGGNFPYP